MPSIKTSTLRLDPETLRLLDIFAQEEGTNRTAIIRKLARDKAREKGYPINSIAVSSRIKKALAE